jgi:hypothetical protein
MGNDVALKRQLDTVATELDATAPIVATRRRGRGLADDQGEPITTTMRLVERDGVLQVEDDSEPVGDERQRRGREGRSVAGQVVWEKDLVKLDRSKVTEALSKLDAKLTPHQGLRRLTATGVLESVDRPSDEGAILLLVHGTFSNTENLLEGVKKSPNGIAFLTWAHQRFPQVLAFDHPTLSVSPIINARTLSLLFRNTNARVDVVSHSRGGLVTRWWLEAFDRAPPDSRRAVFVGAPLAGTGLAAPPNIRQSLSLLANIGKALGGATSAIPFLMVVTGVFRVISAVTSIMAKTPAVDAAVALVPGLFAQSRVGNNGEILSLRESPVRWRERYFAVRSNFESEKVGWKFWKYFRKLGDRAKDAVADLVFDGDNDLVVDTGSMAELSTGLSIGQDQVLDFGTTDIVHHTNYFEQPKTLAFIQQHLR